MERRMASLGDEQHCENLSADAPKGLVVESRVSHSIYIDTMYVSKSSYRESSREVGETGPQQEGEDASWLSHWGMGGGIAVNLMEHASDIVSWTCDGSAKEVIVRLQGGRTKRLAFDVGVFSPCGCLVDRRGEVMVAVMTVDKYLHLVTLGSSVDVSSQYFGFELDDVPVSLVLMDGVVCVGKQRGSIACVDFQRGVFTGSVSNLGAQGGILGNIMGSYLGSFFGGGGGSVGRSNAGDGVACMDVVSVRGDDGAKTLLLCCLYSDASLRVWDVKSKDLVHEGALLPPHEAEKVTPTFLTHSEDVLHEGGYFLIVSFEMFGEEESKSHLCLFEMTIQDRKHGVFNIHVDISPRLTGVNGRLTSASLEYIGSGYHVWFVSENEKGSTMQRISFEGETDGRHSGVMYAIQSAEERLRVLGGSSDIDREMLKMYYVAIGSLLKRGNLIDYILDDVFLPGNMSMAAMKATLGVLGIKDDGKKKDIRAGITSWILDNAAAEPFSRCLSFLDAYLVEYHRRCCPVAIRVTQRQGDGAGPKAVAVVRGDGKMSYLFDAHPFELIRYHSRLAESEAGVVGEFYSVMNVFTSSAAVSMALYALRQGVNLKEELLPALVKVATGHVRTDAVEFGKKALPVRKVLRNFPVILNDWEPDVIGPVVDQIMNESKGVVLDEEWNYEDEGNKGFPYATFMHSSLHSFATARLDLLIKLGVALEYCSGNTNLLQLDLTASKKLDALCTECFSVLYVHWACMQNICLQEPEHVRLPELRADEDVCMEEPFSKRAKRESGKEEIYALEIILRLIKSLPELCDIQDMSNVRDVVLDSLGQKNIDLPAALMHSILHDVRIVNMDAVVESLMHVFNAFPVLGGLEMKVFRAFLRLKMCHRVKDSYDKTVQEQEALSVLLSFEYACEEVSADSIRLCKSLESVCAWMGISCDAFHSLSWADYLDRVGEIVERLGCNDSVKYVTLFSARSYERLESSEGVGKSDRAWGKLYNMLKDEGHLEEAYVASLSILDPQRQRDCIRNLVDHICSSNALVSLCSLPLVELSDLGNINVFGQISHALWDKALKEPIDESRAYFVLYDFYVSRGNFQSAAAAVLSHCRRMVKESDHGSLEIALSLQKMLTLAEGCLKMVDPVDAWLEDSNPLDPETFVRELVSDDAVGTTEYTIPNVIDIKSVRREYALVKALVHVASIIPNYEMNKNEKEIFSQLLTLALYDEAWNLAKSVFSWSHIQEAREKIVFHLSKDATISGSREAWRKLKSFINDTDVCNAVQDKMRLAAVEAILTSDTSMGIPPWILEPYMCQYEFLSGKSTPKGKMNDSMGMIRLLLQYRKLELAAKLALELLGPVTTSASSIALPKVGSINLPHDVLSQLLSLLEGAASTYPSLESLHGMISSALDLANTSAAQQTGALEKILST